MNPLREAAQQALEALETLVPTKGPSIYNSARDALRAALAQQDQPQGCATEEECTYQPWCRIRGTCQRKQADPDISRCPRCGSAADNGHDRELPPNPYFCSRCMAQQTEPVEPVAWLVMDESGYVQHAASWRDAAHEHINDAINEHDLVCARTWRVVPAYTAPPQRKPLPKHDQHCVDVPGYGLMAVRLVRAVERAHGIKE